MAFPAYPDLLSERPRLAKITVLREGTGQGARQGAWGLQQSVLWAGHWRSGSRFRGVAWPMYDPPNHSHTGTPEAQ